MNIVHFHNSLYIGGIDTFIRDLLNEMAKEHNITLCTFYSMNQHDGLLPTLETSIKYMTLGNKRLSIFTKLKNLFKIPYLINKGKFDIVHIHGAFNFYILAVLFLHKRVGFFYTIHSDAFMENGPLSRKMLWLKRYFFRKKYIVPITISKNSQKSFYALYGCESLLIENGINPPLSIESSTDAIRPYRYNKSTKVFLHAGRICKAKNQIVLCKVFERLIRANYDVVLLIAGPQEDHEIYKNIVPFLSNRIVYIGPQSNIIDYLAYADGMCLPSIYEGLPIILLESLALGCIPICSPVGGVPNVITNGSDGIVSLSSSEDDYYKSMCDFLNLDDKHINVMKLKCKETSDKYNIKVSAKKYLFSYQGKPVN